MNARATLPYGRTDKATGGRPVVFLLKGDCRSDNPISRVPRGRRCLICSCGIDTDIIVRKLLDSILNIIAVFILSFRMFALTGRCKIFFFYSIASRPGLGPTQPSIQWVEIGPFPGRKSDHSPPSSVVVENDGAIHPLPHTPSWCGAELSKRTV
jgi:hypothetical protein